MLTAGKQMISNLLEKIANSVNLDAKKIVTWYSYVLFIIPIAFWLLIEIRNLISMQTWNSMLKQPSVAIASIVALIDFMLGYYLLIRKQELLSSYENYRFFMMWQAICQILVGNFVCFILALIGIHEAKQLNSGQRNSKVVTVTVTSGLLLTVCFSLILMINFI